MNRFVCLVAFTLCVAFASPAIATAGIRLENESRSTLQVYLQGEKEDNYRGPYAVPPRRTRELDVPPGMYNVVIRHPDKRFDYLGWHNYSNHRISYRISLCDSCAYVPAGKKRAAPPPQIGVASVHYAHEYKCPACGKMHRRWLPGWKPDDVRLGRVNDQGVLLNFDYRLGVAVIDGDDCVIVTESLEHSPSRKLYLIGGSTLAPYGLQVGKDAITGVNQKPTRNTAEFLKAMEQSPHRIELTVYNSRTKISANYWTDWSE